MHKVAVVVGGALLGGCYPDYPSVEEACPEDVSGGELLEPGTETFFVRLNCHRRYVNLEDAWVNAEVQAATSSHLRYLDQNGILDPQSPRYDPTGRGVFGERDGYSSYTGADAIERLFASGAIAEGEPYGVWAVFLGGSDPSDPAVADAILHDPWVRDPLFQPWWRGAGLATYDLNGVPFTYIDIVYTIPPATRMDRPIVYPKDGQEGVPTGFITREAPDEPLGSGAIVGYPITITVGSYEQTFDENPYDLVLQDAVLSGPDGPVEWLSGGPDSYSWGANQATIVIAARNPLLPNTTYTIEALLSWNARLNKSVTATFTTGDSLTVQ